MRFLTTMFNAHICVSKIVMVYTTEPATGDPASVYADLDGGSTMTLMRLAKHSDALKAAKLIVRLLSNGMDITNLQGIIWEEAESVDTAIIAAERSEPSVSRLNRLKLSVAEFELTQSKFDEFGAADTEPDGKFQHLVSLASAGKLSTVNLTAAQWQLYTETPGADAAADALNKAANKVVDLIAGCAVGEFGDVHKYLRGYCWRISTFAEDRS